MCLMNPMKLNRGEDITVYKVLGQDENGGLHSPIHNFDWVVGETASIDDKAVFKEYHYFNYTATSVEGNAFHSFREKETAEQYLRSKEGVFCKYKKFVVAECVIPADSKFVYLGAYNTGDDSYASEKLKVVSYV